MTELFPIYEDSFGIVLKKVMNILENTSFGSRGIKDIPY